MKQILKTKGVLMLLTGMFFLKINISYGQNQTTRIEIESPSIFVESFGQYQLSWGITTVGEYTGDRSSGTGNRYFID